MCPNERLSVGNKRAFWKVIDPNKWCPHLLDKTRVRKLVGEEQKKLDVLSNEVFVKALSSSGRTENEEAIVVPTQLRERVWLLGTSALEHQPILFSFQRRKTGRSLRNRSVPLLYPCTERDARRHDLVAEGIVVCVQLGAETGHASSHCGFVLEMELS